MRRSPSSQDASARVPLAAQLRSGCRWSGIVTAWAEQASGVSKCLVFPRKLHTHLGGSFLHLGLFLGITLG